MAFTEKERAAWKICDFCSKQPYEIAEMIRDRDQWKNLPLQYKCAWKIICSVGFGRFGRKRLWKELCQFRTETNNNPSYDYSPSSWNEWWCENYRSIETSMKNEQYKNTDSI
jgi:hypothetical protein